MKIGNLFLWIGLIPLLAGCALVPVRQAAMDDRPADLEVHYEWQEGSLPPPYHYEYTIYINPDGQGEMTLIPDYPSEGVPTWTETFAVSPDELDRLYQDLVEQGLFTQDWRAEADSPVGGSSQWLEITAHGQQIKIPAYVTTDQQPRVEAMVSALKALVPGDAWERLEARRQQYMEAHPDG